MNPLALAAMLLASSSLVFFAQRSSLQRLRTANQRLAGEAESVRRAAAETQRAIASLKGGLEAKREQRAVPRSMLSTEEATSDAIPMRPEQEGVWPPDKPYFYLKKEYLTDAFFQRFAPDFHLKPDAAILLGMTQNEAAAVDDAFHSAMEKFRALEAALLIPSNEDAGPRWKGRKTSYQLPELADEIQPIRDEFSSSISNLLGAARAEIFSRRADVVFKGLNNLGAGARTFTFTVVEMRPGEDWHSGDGRTLTRLDVREEGTENGEYFEFWAPPRNMYPEGFPEEQIPRRRMELCRCCCRTIARTWPASFILRRHWLGSGWDQPARFNSDWTSNPAPNTWLKRRLT